MNVFVLSTGRCGSETFARACQHIANFTAAHESHSPTLHPRVQRPYAHLRYPDQHIEVDNRLSWFLGTLEKEYGDRAYYVHLVRNREEVARSLSARGEECILFAFASGVLQYYNRARGFSEERRYQIGLQYWDTVNDNIELFLRDKPRQQRMRLEDIKGPFQEFCQAIGAEGDLAAALKEWDVKHNRRKTVSRGWAAPERDDEVRRQLLLGVVPPRHEYVPVESIEEEAAVHWTI